MNETLCTIRDDQGLRDCLPDIRENMRAKGFPEDQIEKEAAKTQADVARLHTEVSAIVADRVKERDIARLLSYIRALEASQ
jgi:hypothetical protein